MFTFVGKIVALMYVSMTALVAERTIFSDKLTLNLRPLCGISCRFLIFFKVRIGEAIGLGSQVSAAGL